MPYANNQGVRIHYQVVGRGPALVLHHGSGGSGEDWHDLGYVEGLKNDYRLILIDARGHGASDKPHDPAAYEMKLRVADIVAVLDNLNIRKSHFFGYSMGGWIRLGVAKYAPQRFYSLIIGASHPYARSFEFARQNYRRIMESAIADREQVIGPFPPELEGYKARLLSSNFEALVAGHEDRPNMEEVLPTMTMPSLFFVGEADPLYPQVKECVGHVPDATFFSLPGLDHLQALLRRDLVLPHVTKFLQGVGRKTRATV